MGRVFDFLTIVFNRAKGFQFGDWAQKLFGKAKETIQGISDGSITINVEQ